MSDPHGLCLCGCGSITNTWKQSRLKEGIRKGDHKRYIKGHYQSQTKQVRYSKCHPDRIHKSQGLCGACYNKSLDARDSEKKVILLERRRETRAERYVVRDAEEYSRKQKSRVLRHRYGIDVSEYEALRTKQNNCCAICGKKGGNTRGNQLFVDHNHSTGGFRELICPGCNIAVGRAEKGIEHLSTIIAYLAKHDFDTNRWQELSTFMLTLISKETK